MKNSPPRLADSLTKFVWQFKNNISKPRERKYWSIDNYILEIEKLESYIRSLNTELQIKQKSLDSISRSRNYWRALNKKSKLWKNVPQPKFVAE